MSRVTKPAEIRRSELIDTALAQFLEKGYAGTSVRSILSEAGGKIGMFYHHFKSKQEIFEAALARYGDRYFLRMTALLDDESLPVPDRLTALFTLLSETFSRLSVLEQEARDADFCQRLIQQSLDRTLPSAQRLIEQAVAQGLAILPQGVNPKLSVGFLLYGAAGLLATPAGELSQRVAQLKSLVRQLFSVREGLL